MESIEQIGIIAGKLWNYLSKKNDYVDLLDLKFALRLSNTTLFLALGWLAREGKIQFQESEHSVKIKLSL